MIEPAEWPDAELDRAAAALSLPQCRALASLEDLHTAGWWTVLSWAKRHYGAASRMGMRSIAPLLDRGLVERLEVRDAEARLRGWVLRVTRKGFAIMDRVRLRLAP